MVITMNRGGSLNASYYLDLSELKRFSSAEFVVFELLKSENISDFDFFGESWRFEKLILPVLRASLFFRLDAPLKTLLDALLLPLIDPSTEMLSGSFSAGTDSLITLSPGNRASLSQAPLLSLNFEFAF